MASQGSGTRSRRGAGLGLAVLARTAGVSRMTVSRALRGVPGVSAELRQQIRRLAMELGYARPDPARPQVRESRLVGVITPHLHRSYSSEVLAGIYQEARDAGYDVLVCSPNDGLRAPGSVVRQIEAHAEGVVVLHAYGFQHPSTAARGRIPLVAIDYAGERPPFPSVAADSYGGARAAMHHLLALGHRRIALITGADEFASAKARRTAYEDALAEAGLPLDPELVGRGKYTERGGHDAAARLLRVRPRPTAIFASNDLSAVGALRAAAALGLRVPRDLSLVGFDDAPEATEADPQLTTVRQPIAEIGRRAFERLLALMQGRPAGELETLVPTKLVVRASTGPPPRAGRA